MARLVAPFAPRRCGFGTSRRLRGSDDGGREELEESCPSRACNSASLALKIEPEENPTIDGMLVRLDREAASVSSHPRLLIAKARQATAVAHHLCESGERPRHPALCSRDAATRGAVRDDAAARFTVVRILLGDREEDSFARVEVGDFVRHKLGLPALRRRVLRRWGRRQSAGLRSSCHSKASFGRCVQFLAR